MWCRAGRNIHPARHQLVSNDASEAMNSSAIMTALAPREGALNGLHGPGKV
jgi:hypothetical protein